MMGESEIPTSLGSFDWEESMSAAIDAAEAAATLLMVRFRPEEDALLEVHYKHSGEIVTDADLASDVAIRETLEALGDTGNILSEESIHYKADSQFTWIVDPLCGTIPFSTGLALWGINIALSVRDQLEVGVIALPASGEILSAARGHGAFLNGEKLDTKEPPGNLPDILLAFEGDKRSFTDSQRALEHAAGRQYTFASAAFPLAQVILGRLHGFVGSTLDVHTAAGTVIAREMGICVTDEAGNDVNWTHDISCDALVAAWPRTHSTLLNRVTLK